MIRRLWENIKAAAIVFLIALAVFISYFLVIFGTIALVLVGLFFIVKLLGGYYVDEYEDEDQDNSPPTSNR